MKNTMSFILTSSLALGISAIIMEEVEKAYDNIECLAMNVYHESRGEDLQGQYAVAHVTMNRVNHSYFPDDVCLVVWDDHQFSWTNDGRSDNPSNEDSFHLAKKVAIKVYFGEHHDNTNGSLFYHTTSVDPDWNDHESLTQSVQLGDHIFYNWTGTWN